MQNRGKWWYAATLGDIRGGVSERPQLFVTRQADSQDDSQLAGPQRTRAHDRGIRELAIELQWTLMDGCGRQARGLQNRLWGFANPRITHPGCITLARASPLIDAAAQLSIRVASYPDLRRGEMLGANNQLQADDRHQH